MGLSVVEGPVDIGAMAALASWILGERLLPRPDRICWLGGLVLISWGAAIVADAAAG
jgi:hypothetical protein